MIITGPMLFGAAKGITGIMSAIGGYNQQNAAVRARNDAAVRNYKQQLLIRQVNWNNTLNRYGQQKIDYSNDLRENNLSAQRAYASEQMRLNEIVKGAAFKAEDRMIATLKAQGTMAARGVSGQSAAKARQSVLAAAGRAEARSMASLDSAYQNMQLTNERTRDRLRIANTNAYRNVQFAPQPGVAPLAPTFENGPSPFSLLSGIGGAALDGVSAGYEMDNLING